MRGIMRLAEVTDLSGREDLIGFLNALSADADPALRDLARDCLSRVVSAAAPARVTRASPGSS